jgi:prepilin-type N-terminal cleavage/methylation domain-containing protein
MSKDRARARGRGGRGFSLVELLVVLAVLGLTLTIAGTEVIRTIKRSFLRSTSQQIQLLASRAQLEAQRRSAEVFLRIGPFGSGPGGTIPVELWADADGDAAFDSTKDLRLEQILLDPARISLSTAATNQIQTANWSNDTDNSTERLLACNTFGRTMNPATGLQIAGTATLSVTHADMVVNTLQPRLNEQLRISPAWSVETLEVKY